MRTVSVPNDSQKDLMLELSPTLCPRFIDETESFFERIFTLIGWATDTVLEQ